MKEQKNILNFPIVCLIWYNNVVNKYLKRVEYFLGLGQYAVCVNPLSSHSYFEIAQTETIIRVW